MSKLVSIIISQRFANSSWRQGWMPVTARGKISLIGPTRDSSSKIKKRVLQAQ